MVKAWVYNFASRKNDGGRKRNEKKKKEEEIYTLRELW